MGQELRDQHSRDGRIPDPRLRQDHVQPHQVKIVSLARCPGNLQRMKKKGANRGNCTALYTLSLSLPKPNQIRQNVESLNNKNTYKDCLTNLRSLLLFL